MPESKLRFGDLVGQSAAISRLKEFSAFHAKTGGTPGHILITGEDGLGKATLARAFANERGVDLKEIEAEGIVSNADLSSPLTNLRPDDILILNHLQLLRKLFLPKLLEAMSSGKFQIIIGQGPGARAHTFELPPFTLVASCRRSSDCPASLLSEFAMVLELQPYSVAELSEIARRVATKNDLRISPEAAQLIAKHSARRPRDIEATLLRTARAVNKPYISDSDVRNVLMLSGVSVDDDARSGPSGVGCLTGQEFESLICRLLESMDFRTELTKVTGDGGIDIVAFLEKPIIGGKYLFQCKRYGPDNTVGASAVRDFYGAVTADRAVKGIFVTTSEFTPQAREFAERAGIELIDQAKLKMLLHDSGIR